MVRCFFVAAFCVLGPLCCVAQNVNGEATYVSFSVPGALGTYPMSINASMTVTGYYDVSSTVTRGFVRAADGTITSFDVQGGLWTEPESINAAGDITGFYELTAGVPQGFLRYADGHIITFDPPPNYNTLPPEGLPVSINEFGDIAGTYPYPLWTPVVFTRSSAGVFNTISLPYGNPDGTVAAAINASGAVVGYRQYPEATGFLAHPDGFSAEIVVPVAADQSNCREDTIPEGINAGGMIAGWYLSYSPTYNDACGQKNVAGFVLSPDGVFTLFNPPGTLSTMPLAGFPVNGLSLTAPHTISIDQAGDIAGSYTDAAGVQHGFVRNAYGTITTFDPPEGKQTSSTSINDGGAVAGFYQYNSGAGPPMGFVRVPLS